MTITAVALHNWQKKTYSVCQPDARFFREGSVQLKHWLDADCRILHLFFYSLEPRTSLHVSHAARDGADAAPLSPLAHILAKVCARLIVREGKHGRLLALSQPRDVLGLSSGGGVNQNVMFCSKECLQKLAVRSKLPLDLSRCSFSCRGWISLAAALGSPVLLFPCYAVLSCLQPGSAVHGALPMCAHAASAPYGTAVPYHTTSLTIHLLASAPALSDS